MFYWNGRPRQIEVCKHREFNVMENSF